MITLAGDRPGTALLLLRVALAVLIGLHGIARVADGGVDDFGGFLNASHIPLGPAVAWLITIVEIAGGLAFGLGILVRPLAAWFVIQLLMGIVLVHARNGWFVVGLGRNGVEYSVLLIVCFTVVALGSGTKIVADGGARRDAPSSPPGGD